MTNSYILVGLLLLASLWTVLTPTLLRSAIGLAVTSAVLTMLMFEMSAPLAAVFELSVCAGLITVVFVSTISLTKPLTLAEAATRRSGRSKRFWPLAAIVVAMGALLWAAGLQLEGTVAPAADTSSLREVLWLTRSFDLLGQIIIFFVGVFGVVVLFKERKATGGKEGDQ